MFWKGEQNFDFYYNNQTVSLVKAQERGNISHKWPTCYSFNVKMASGSDKTAASGRWEHLGLQLFLYLLFVFFWGLLKAVNNCYFLLLSQLKGSWLIIKSSTWQYWWGRFLCGKLPSKVIQPFTFMWALEVRCRHSPRVHRWSWFVGLKVSAWPWWTETWTRCSWRLLLDRFSPSASCKSFPSHPRAKGWASSSGYDAWLLLYCVQTWPMNRALKFFFSQFLSS